MSWRTVLILAAWSSALAVCGAQAPQQEAQQVPSSVSKGPDLLEEIRTLMEDHYHKPSELSDDRWQRFWTQLEEDFSSDETREARFAAFRAAATELGISHLALQDSPPSPAGDPSADPVRLSYPRADVALLEVDYFDLYGTTAALSAALTEVAHRNLATLIVDLRRTQGADVSSILLAGHLLDRPVPAGVFLARKWWEAHEDVPRVEDWPSLPTSSELSLEPLHRALEETGALLGVVPPMRPSFKGQVFVLAGRETASAAEPVVHLMKQRGLATVIGERTAGRMLSSESFELDDGSWLVVPVADYFSADGTRIEGNGVAPHIELDASEALEEALRLAEASDEGFKSRWWRTLPTR